MVKKTIDLDTKLAIPLNIGIETYNELSIIIAVDYGNWIIAKNRIQVDILNCLKSHSIGETIDLYPDNYSDIRDVVTQIIAKDFCNPNVLSVRKNSLQLHITNACNLRCKHCYMFSGEKDSDELTFDEIKEIITEFALGGGEEVVFTGGEVLLFPNFRNILEVSKKAGLRNVVMTNGVLWSKSLAKDCASLIESVQVSIDGYDEESNSKVRGKGNYNKALQAVENFIEYGIDTQISVTPLFENPDKEVICYVHWAKELLDKFGTEKFKIVFNSKLFEGRDIKVDDFILEEYGSFIDKIYYGIYGCEPDLNFIEGRKQKQIFDNCGFGNLCINSKGDVFFCGRISGIKSYFNVKHTKLGKLLELRQKAQKYSNVNNLIPCKDCNLKNICGGGCRLEYFQGFCDNCRFDTSPKRVCSQKQKKEVLELLIRTNEKLFS